MAVLLHSVRTWARGGGCVRMWSPHTTMQSPVSRCP